MGEVWSLPSKGSVTSRQLRAGSVRCAEAGGRAVEKGGLWTGQGSIPQGDMGPEGGKLCG